MCVCSEIMYSAVNNYVVCVCSEIMYSVVNKYIPKIDNYRSRKEMFKRVFQLGVTNYY